MPRSRSKTFGGFRYVRAAPSREVVAIDMRELVEDMAKGPSQLFEKAKDAVETITEVLDPNVVDLEGGEETAKEPLIDLPAKEEQQPDEEELTIEERQKQIYNTVKERDLDKLVLRLVDDSYELLNGAGVKHQKAKEIYKEKDGLDIVIDIDPGVLKDAEVVFDWTIGTFWSKWFTLQKSFLESKHTLQEVQFLYCDATYIAHDPQQIENLLSAIATLQEVDRRPLTEMETPDPNDKADIQDWALEIVSQLLSRHPNARVEGVQNVKKLVEEDEEAGNFKEGTADKFAEFVDDLGSGEWQELMSENLSALKSQRQFKSSRKVIERAIQQLSEGKYKADFAVNYADDGSLLATLIAPFPVMIRFEREGGEVQFKELVTSICDSAFIATSFDQAKDLLKANVNLGIAAGEVADDSISKDRKDKPAQDPEDVAEDVAEDLAEDEDVAKVMKEMKEGPEEGEEIDKRIERFSNIFKSKQKRREFLHWVESNPKAATNFFSVNDDLREWLGKNYPDVHAQIAQTIYR